MAERSIAAVLKTAGRREPFPGFESLCFLQNRFHQVAERLRSGLQLRAHGFEPRPGVHHWLPASCGTASANFVSMQDMADDDNPSLDAIAAGDRIRVRFLVPVVEQGHAWTEATGLAIRILHFLFLSVDRGPNGQSLLMPAVLPIEEANLAGIDRLASVEDLRIDREARRRGEVVFPAPASRPSSPALPQ